MGTAYYVGELLGVLFIFAGFLVSIDALHRPRFARRPAVPVVPRTGGTVERR
jgi:hypothetical protein